MFGAPQSWPNGRLRTSKAPGMTGFGGIWSLRPKKIPVFSMGEILARWRFHNFYSSVLRKFSILQVKKFGIRFFRIGRPAFCVISCFLINKNKA
jgi:hypothetical protein